MRLRYAYFVTCTAVIKNDAGEVVELRCTYDPATRGGDAPDGRKVKGTLHWVSAPHAADVEVRLYNHLFNTPTPEKTAEGQEFTANLSADSLQVLTGCKLEPNWNQAAGPDWPDQIRRLQFERHAYFCEDKDSTRERPVFNRTVTLKDSWAKEQKKDG